MENLKISAFILIILIGFTSCEKQRNLKMEDKKLQTIISNGGEWQIDRFEIDGGDSTTQQLGVAGSGNYVRVLKFIPKAEKSDQYYNVKVGQSIGNYYFDSDDKAKLYFHDYGSSNCPTSGTVYKPGEIHDIFLLVPHSDTEWEIVELNSEKFILSCNYKKKYVIRLSKYLAGY